MHRQQLSCTLVSLSKFFHCKFLEWSRVSYNETVQVFISFMRFLLQSLILRSFLVLLIPFFLIFFPSFPLVRWCPLPIFSRTYSFPSLKAFSSFPNWAILFLSHFSLSTWHIFQIPFLYLGCIFLLFVSGSPVLFYWLQIPLYHPCK